MKAVIEGFTYTCPCLISLMNAHSDLKKNTFIEADSCQ